MFLTVIGALTNLPMMISIRQRRYRIDIGKGDINPPLLG